MKHLKYFEYDKSDIFGKKWRTGDDDVIKNHDVVTYYGTDSEIPYGSKGTVVHIDYPFGLPKNILVEFIINNDSLIKDVEISEIRK
jgi:hypothetical protein